MRAGEKTANPYAWELVDLGVDVPYPTGIALQERRHAEVAAGLAPDALLLLEHRRVITCGRNTQPGHVLRHHACL